MAEPIPVYLVDPSGETVQVHPAAVLQARQMGYLPASPGQIKDYQRTEKFSTTGQQLKTFGEGAAQSLTLGLSTLVERGLGVDPEDIKARQEINPGAHTAGALAGVAAPLILSGGASAAAESAEGASGLMGALRGASQFTAPGLIAKAGEGAGELAEGLLPEATTALGRAGAAALKAGVGAGTEGALYGVGNVVHEKALGDPNLTAQSAMEEIGLSGLLGGAVGAGAGLLGGLTREALGSELGDKLSQWTSNFEGNQNIKTAAGPGKGQAALKGLYKQMSPEAAAKLGQEAGDLGLVSAFDGPAAVLEKAEALKAEVGPKIGGMLESADAAGIKPSAFEDIGARVHEEVVAPLAENPLTKGTAEHIGSIIDDEADRFSAKGETGFRDLHKLRKELDDKIYGLRGDMNVGSNELKDALHQVRSIVSDEINKGIESGGAGSSEWRTLNRQYSVASRISKIAEKGTAGAGLSGVSLTALMAGGAGLIHGGPLGAAALGLAAQSAKRYGPQALAAGARGVRRFIDAGGAESVINKSAELIAGERAASAGLEASGAAQGASKLVGAFGRAAEKAEPFLAPVQDAARDSLQEQVAHKMEGESSSAPEKVAALSQLAAANKRVSDRVNTMAARLLTGEIGAAAAATVARSADDYEKQMDQVHQLASNPQKMQEHLASQTSGLPEHAPEVSQAYSLAASRAIGHLHAKYPAPAKLGPIGPRAPVNKDTLYRYNRDRQLIDKPSHLLHHASVGTLTPADVETVRAVAPERLAQMQKAVMEQAAGHEGKIPYKSRLGISLLMGQDMDGTTSQAAIASSQAVFHRPSAKSPENQTGPAATGKSTQTGLSKLSASRGTMLPGQATDERVRSAKA